MNKIIRKKEHIYQDRSGMTTTSKNAAFKSGFSSLQNNCAKF